MNLFFRPSQSGDVVFRFQLDGEVTLMVDGKQVAQKCICQESDESLYVTSESWKRVSY